MAEVNLICGKICAGKTTYARKLTEARPAVLLSCDQAVLALYGMYLGEEHETVTGKVKRYLLELALDILRAGADVILDWGFWTAADRKETGEYFASRGFTPRWHYVDCTRSLWEENVRSRNAEVTAGDTSAYFVDGPLAEKCLRAFQPPRREEMDVWYCREA